MKTINFDVIKKDLTSDKKDIFYLEFPDLKKVLDDVVAKPTCGICINALSTSLFAHPQIDEKLKIIYGNDIAIDKKVSTPTNGRTTEQVTDIQHIDLNDWEEWFKVNSISDASRQIRLITTFYNPASNKITVSRVIFRPKK